MICSMVNISCTNSLVAPTAATTAPILTAPAALHVLQSHSQPFYRAHCSTSRCPPLAASRHVPLSHSS
jgi:hypothetical protein